MINTWHNIPKWMTYWAFYSTNNRKTPVSVLRLLMAYFDLHPSQIMKKAWLSRHHHHLIGHIHMPKTGGTYVSSLEDTFPHINFSHCLIRNDRTDRFCPTGLTCISSSHVKSFFLFSCVRNPLNFLVSYYYHVKGGKPEYKNPNHYDFTSAQKGFSYLLETIMNRTDKWPSRKFLYPQLFNQKGSCIIDWINRQEALNADLEKLGRYFNTVIHAKKKQRVSEKQVSYAQHYSDDLFEKVTKVYQREMALFGYDGFDILTPMVETKPLEKKRIGYDYIRDQLFVDGKIFKKRS